MDYDFDYPIWLPPSGDFAEKLEKEIYNKYKVTCYFKEIIKDLDFEFNQLCIGWIILIPEELSQQFEVKDIWVDFQLFVHHHITKKLEFGLRSFFISKREIRLIYATDEDTSKYLVDHLIHKNW